MRKIAIFASGSGSNAEEIFMHFRKHKDVNVSLLVCNKPSAYVLTRAEKYNIPTFIVDRETFYESELLLQELYKHSIDFIVLAGFLWLIPAYLIENFDNAMINIHPALLPDYGGKGMYGIHVHRAVKENSEGMSGITIHYVNQEYDKGKVIFQASCKIDKEDNEYQIAEKVQKLEHKYYPTVIESLLLPSK